MAAVQRRGILAAAAGLAAVAALVVPSSSATAAVTTSTVLTDADSYVDSGSPTQVKGSASDLRIRQSRARVSYLRFTVPTQPGTVSAASLQVYGLSSCSVSAGVGRVTAAWSESTLNWNNRPAVGPSLGRFSTRSAAGWSTLSVLSAVPSSGSVSFTITAESSGSCSYASRERGSSTRAKLVLTRTVADPSPSPSATPPQSTDPVVVAVGDMTCDPTDQNYNGGNGLGSYCRDRAVADLVASLNPSTLLALGDMQYEDGTLAKFQSTYDPTWGRFNSIVRPVVGNHEYLDPGAAGYFSYFGAKAGDPSQGWYSFNVGSWHIVVLNGECTSVAGGCSAGSPQENWLRADLAANPAACTMAVWHRPRFTSGEAQAATTPQGQGTFWSDLYAAGADVVLGGHIHNYERFATINRDGVADPAGIRQFVVGTGGKSLVGYNATTWPTSQFRDSTHYGALKLVLRPTGYDWQFLPIGGGPAIDAGSQSCH